MHACMHDCMCVYFHTQQIRDRSNKEKYSRRQLLDEQLKSIRDICVNIVVSTTTQLPPIREYCQTRLLLLLLSWRRIIHFAEKRLADRSEERCPVERMG